MIAKASTIPHGANAIRYSVNKDRADIVKANLLPDDISPEAMYGRMMLVQKMFAEKINKGRPLGRNVIRIEISPSEEESRNWTMDDWVRLADEFIQVFDSIDLSQKTKRASSKQTNLKGSQYIVALHRDSKSGILHLHIDANRVDINGKSTIAIRLVRGLSWLRISSTKTRMGTVQRNRHTAQAGNLKLLYGDISCDGQIQLATIQNGTDKTGLQSAHTRK